MKISIRIATGITLCVLLAASAFAQRIVGGYSDQSKTDPDVVAAANFAVQEENKTRKGITVELVSIERAEKQIVAGANYRLCLAVKIKGATEQATATVYLNLQNEYSLTSWEAGKCGASETTDEDPTEDPTPVQDYALEKNSPAHAAVFGALRVPVAKELKRKVTFATDRVKAKGNWAFVSGQVRGADGGAFNFKNTKYQKRIDVDAFENNLFALLKKTGGKWRVVTYMIGCLDVCYLGWDKQYKAPKSIFE